jgi:hypothetical protein
MCPTPLTVQPYLPTCSNCTTATTAAAAAGTSLHLVPVRYYCGYSSAAAAAASATSLPPVQYNTGVGNHLLLQLQPLPLLLLLVCLSFQSGSVRTASGGAGRFDMEKMGC